MFLLLHSPAVRLSISVVAMGCEITEQRYKQLIDYIRCCRLHQPVYPSCFNTNQKRGQAACFEEKDGVLFHSLVDSNTQLKRLRRVVVTAAEKNRLIQACHGGIDGGHHGRDKALSKVSHSHNPRLLACDLDMPPLQLAESY